MKEITNAVIEVLIAYPKTVKAYRNGEHGKIGILTGEIMKQNRDFDPKIVIKILKEELEK